MAALYQVSYGPFSAQKANSRDLRGRRPDASFASTAVAKGNSGHLHTKNGG